MTVPSILLGAISLEPGNGGVSDVARLTARALAGRAAAGELTVRAVALLDREAPADLDLDVTACRTSRGAFAVALHRHAPAATHLVFDTLAAARARPRLPGLRRPHLAWIHGVEVWERARTDRLAQARAATQLVSNSTHTRARADALHGGFARAEVCWLGTASSEPRPRGERPPGPPRVLILARMDSREDYKGHRELIACWPQVVRAVPGAVLTVAGRGDLRPALEEQARRSGMPDAIEFRGYVPDEALEALWAEADVLAMPSRGEGFGIVYVEAMRHGLPVVASVHDAGAEVNADGETGYVVDLDDPAQLPDRVIRLLSDPAHAWTLGRAGLARWQEHFSYEAFRARFDRVIDRFLAST